MQIREQYLKFVIIQFCLHGLKILLYQLFIDSWLFNARPAFFLFFFQLIEEMNLILLYLFDCHLLQSQRSRSL